jgi:hypothetical protein
MSDEYRDIGNQENIMIENQSLALKMGEGFPKAVAVGIYDIATVFSEGP